MINLKILRKFLFISLFIIPQNFHEIKASKLYVNGSNFKKPSKDLLLSGWKPLSDKSNKDYKAGDQTIKTLKKFKKMSSLQPYFRKAQGYAVFPNIGKGGFGVGGARGKGEVFEKGNVIGSTTLTQLSIGWQLGGQAFSQIIFFNILRSNVY